MTKLQRRIAFVASLVLVGVFIAYGFVPAWQSLNTDFVNYYVAARAYRQGDTLSHVYDWIWFQRQKDHEGIENRIITFSPLTLYSAMPIVPLTSLSALSAKRFWLVINLLLLGFSGFLLNKMTALGRAPVVFLMFLAVGPLVSHFLFGQLYILVLALLVLSLWLYLKDWPVVSGLMLALGAAVKIYPIFLVFYFIRKKQWRVVAGLVAGVAILAALAVYLFGMEVNRVYLEQVLPRTLRGDIADPYNLNASSFTAVFHRLFLFEPELNRLPFRDLPLFYAVLQALAPALLLIPLLWLLTPRRAPNGKEMLEFATYIAALLLSSGATSYHCVVLIPCVVFGANFLVLDRRVSQLALLILFYALACMPKLTDLTPMVRLFFTSAFFLLLFGIMTSLAAQTWRERFRSRSALFFLPLIVVLVSVSVSLNVRHVKAAEDFSARVMTDAGSLMKTHPAISGGRIAFTMLQSPVYTIGMLSGNKLSKFETDTDVFHPAFIPGSSEAFVELAGRESKIVKVDLDVPEKIHEKLQIVIANGEQPVVSPDGQWLAFIREVRGRGALWIKPLHPVETQETELTTERELVVSEYDVLEASFDAGSREIIFSAQPSRQYGGPSLFKIGLTSSPITPVTVESPVRYPAFSSDGAWMAYSRLERGSWQIWIKLLASGEERQLTTGMCNSIYPAWMADSKGLIYATDCGRGLSMTSLARVRITP